LDGYIFSSATAILTFWMEKVRGKFEKSPCWGMRTLGVNVGIFGLMLQFILLEFLAKGQRSDPCHPVVSLQTEQ
jgi:hypothetical protein